MSLALKALGRLAMSPDAVHVIHDTANEMTREHLVAVLKRLCLSHERLRAERDAAEQLLNDATELKDSQS
jgi:hypothetical protein